VVNQFTVQGRKTNRRPDVVVFINGLPVAVIELKNPAHENADVWDAHNQLQTYKEEIPDLFVFNEALVISDGLIARVGSLTAKKERFMPWRTLKSENDKPLLEYQLEKVVRGFFDRELFLDYIRFFILFETDGDVLIKKIAAYHQFHAVRAAVQATVIAAEQVPSKRQQEQRATYSSEVLPGSRKAGVVWHTQGSGKSISMACYAGKLLQQPQMNNPTLVVVTDRTDLDGQLFQTFSAAKDLLKQSPQQADSRDSTSGSLSGPTLLPGLNKVTFVPSRFNACPSSRPMMPVPITAIDAGMSSSSKMSSLTNTCSRNVLNGGGMTGELPVAMTIEFALTSV